MNLKGNTILITGGATGIGFALAEEFVKLENTVIICGRREDKLQEAKSKLPDIHTFKCDISTEDGRKFLFEYISKNFKEINILINNAGIQRVMDFKTGKNNLEKGEDEIDINLKTPIKLSEFFIQDFLNKKDAAIVNISSGLAFIPLAITPVYCATKAAIHSFSLSLRHQLKNTSIKVFEIIPPTVDTQLDKGARAQRGQTDLGIKPAEVAKASIEAIQKDIYEFAIGRAENIRQASRTNPDQFFNNMNH